MSSMDKSNSEKFHMLNERLKQLYDERDLAGNPHDEQAISMIDDEIAKVMDEITRLSEEKGEGD